MINQSPLPFYATLAEQHQNFRWYANGQVGPFFCRVNRLPVFTIIRTEGLDASLTVTIVNFNTGAETDISAGVSSSGLYIDTASYSYDVILYAATLDFGSGYSPGNYYLKIEDGTNTWFSDVFSMIRDEVPLVELVYWHLEDFEFDQDEDGNGQFIRYRAPYKSRFLVDSTVSKPRFQYVREVEQRLGRNFPKTHISYKEFRFDFLATEDAVDALRLVPLHDFKQVLYQGRTLNVDELSVSVNWEDEGDLASVEVIFRTNTVAIASGRSTSSTEYEPAAGSCLVTDWDCVGKITLNSTEYNNEQYIDGAGNTVDLEPGDYVLVQGDVVSWVRIYQWYPGSYNLITAAAGSVAFDQSSGLYWSGVGSNNFLLPAVNFYDHGTGAIAGVALDGAQHFIFAVDGLTETLIGVYTYDDIVTTGITGVSLPSGTQFLRMKIASGECGIFQTPTDYPVPPVSGSGIGFMTVETDNIIG